MLIYASWMSYQPPARIPIAARKSRTMPLPESVQAHALCIDKMHPQHMGQKSTKTNNTTCRYDQRNCIDKPPVCRSESSASVLLSPSSAFFCVSFSYVLSAAANPSKIPFSHNSNSKTNKPQRAYCHLPLYYSVSSLLNMRNYGKIYHSLIVKILTGQNAKITVHLLFTHYYPRHASQKSQYRIR